MATRKMRLCFEISKLARNEDGSPAPCGMELSFDVGADHEIEYTELAKSIDIEKLLELAFLNGVVDAEDVVIISPSEYDERYGEGKE